MSGIETALSVVAQPVAAPLTRAAIFLIVTVKPGPDTRAILRSFCGDLAGLFRAVEFRDLEAGLSCVEAISRCMSGRISSSGIPVTRKPPYLQETLTFILLTAEAAVAMAPPKAL